MDQTDQQRQDSLVALAVALTTISTILVLLRSIIRFIIIRNPGLDDFTIIAAMIFAIGYMAEVLVGKANHIGFPMTTLTLDNMTNMLKVTLSIEVTYYATIFCIKISILFMYLRIAVSEIFRMLCYGTIALHTVFFLICIGVTLGQCRPLHKMWDLTGAVQGSCINGTAFFYSTSGFNIITDIWILLLPIKTLKGINRATREKIILVCIFGVGSFAAVMSIVRLHSIYTYTLAADPFKDAIEVNVWSLIEVHVAILCASVPALKPLATPRRLKEISRGRAAGYQYHGRDQSGFGGSGSGGDKSYTMSNLSAKRSDKFSVREETESTKDILGTLPEDKKNGTVVSTFGAEAV